MCSAVSTFKGFNGARLSPVENTAQDAGSNWGSTGGKETSSLHEGTLEGRDTTAPHKHEIGVKNAEAHQKAVCEIFDVCTARTLLTGEKKGSPGLHSCLGCGQSEVPGNRGISNRRQHTG
jgi:hypothetical protein